MADDVGHADPAQVVDLFLAETAAFREVAEEVAITAKETKELFFNQLGKGEANRPVYVKQK